MYIFMFHQLNWRGAVLAKSVEREPSVGEIESSVSGRVKIMTY